MDLNVFFVQRAIVHQIPQARRTEKVKLQPMLADVPIDLDDRRKTYFQRRIRRSLQNGFEAEYDPGSGSPVPARVVEFFADAKGDNFVDVSHDIARHLHGSQGGSSPSGLMAVIEGTIGTGKAAGKCIAVLKLEMEEGVHFELVEKNGVKTFEMQVEEVTLTDTTRVFKASLFTRAGIIADLVGVVSDDQLDSSTAGREIADYFLHRFLGCRIKQTPNIATKRYLEAVGEFLNALPDDDRKMRYDVAVRSELESQSPTINPEEFARDHLDVEDRDLFLARFREADGRVQTIQKDTDLIKTRVTKTWVELDNGVRMTGPPEEVERMVRAIQVATDENGVRLVVAGITRVR